MNARTVRILSIVAAILGLGVVIGLGWRVGERLGDVAWWLDYPFPRQGSEGLTMYEALLTRLGENIYAMPTPSHFISAPYPPIYYYLSGLLLDTNSPSFGAGRWVSLLAAIGAAVISGLLAAAGLPHADKGALARRASLSTLLVMAIPFGLAVLLFGTIYPFVIWAARFRADMLGLALMVGGLLAMQWRPRGAGAWVAAVLFALAFFTKQTLLAGPLAGGLYLLLLAWQQRRHSDAGRGVTFGWLFLWGGVTAALFALPTALLTLLTNGGYWAKLVTYHALPFSSKTLLNLVGALWQNHWPLLIAGAAFGWLAIDDYRRGRQITIVGPYLLAALLLLPTGGVVGADSNHLLSICFALVVANGQLAGRIVATLADESGTSSATDEPVDSRQQLNAPVLAAGAAVGLAVLLAAYIWASAEAAGWYGLDLRRPSEAAQTQLAKIVANVRQNPGPKFLSDEVGLLVLAGKRPDYDDLFDLTALANLGKWDEATLLQQVGNKEFAIILLNNRLEELRGDIMSSGVRAAVGENYKLLFADIWYTYVPK